MPAGAAAERGNMSALLEHVAGRDSEPPLIALELSLMSHDRVVERTCAEVTKPETINYRTLRPEPGGLYCETIFGALPPSDQASGKAGGIDRRLLESPLLVAGEMLPKDDRSERFGRITLAAPVIHPWMVERTPSFAEALTGASRNALTAIMQQTGEPGDSSARLVGMLGNVDLQERASALRGDRDALAIVTAFQDAGVHPDVIVLRTLAVLPPSFRPMVPLEGGRFATSDLNDLYRRVINRNNRLKRLMELNAPEIILYNEQRMLGEAIGALFDNGYTERSPVVGPNARTLVPLRGFAEATNGLWPMLREFDHAVAKGARKTLALPLEKRWAGPVAALRALGFELSVRH